MPIDEFRRSIIQSINDLIDELENITSVISEKAVEHIHSDEIILTFGYSRTVAAFLNAAAKKRSFTLIIVEGYPSLAESAHKMAKSLAETAPSLDIIVLGDSAVFAVMSRVNKVILGAHAIMANGGLVAGAGSSMITQCAVSLNVPVLVVAGTYKLCMQYPYNDEELIEVVGPEQVAGGANDLLLRNVSVLNPQFDYVPPHGIEIYITNLGVHPQSSLYKLMSEQYDTRDLELGLLL
jgi:translation initiation factor eIF-2B subunit beta